MTYTTISDKEMAQKSSQDILDLLEQLGFSSEISIESCEMNRMISDIILNNFRPLTDHTVNYECEIR